VVLQLAVSALVVLAVVAVVGSIVSRRTAESVSIHEAATLTDVLAEDVVQPALTDAMATSPAAAAALDSIVRSRVLSHSILRVKIWSPDGLILYSDEPRLVGHTYQLDSDDRLAFSSPQTRADVSDLSAPENRYERGHGKMLEVYRPIWTPSGHPLLFETYSRYSIVSSRAGDLWRGFSGVMLSSLIAITVLLTPLVWTLLARARRASKQREELLERSMQASTDERERIAASLHDGVVQDLVAASFAISAAERSSTENGDVALQTQLQHSGAAIRTSIKAMRSLLVDIYPASLQASGLVPALTDLVASQHDSRVETRLDEAAAARLSPDQREAVYRIAQECLRNAIRHSGASAISLAVTGEPDAVLLSVTDDGVGFDTEAASTSGHFGHQLVTAQAARIVAELGLRSAPGQGTSWRVRVQTP